MRLSLLLPVVALATSSSAIRLPCGAPYPLDPPTIATLEALQNGTLDRGSQAAATLFGGSWTPQPWPRHTDNVVRIFYCYADMQARGNLQKDIEDAIHHWYDALGGPGSEKAGHGIVFEERLVWSDVWQQIIPQYRFSQHNVWDPAVPQDTLAIRWAPRYNGVAATIGYLEPADGGARNYIIARAGFDTPVHAHELGHVVGMAHEHQRPDLRYACDQLADYDEVYARASPEDRPKLCDVVVAAKYGFTGEEYIRGWVKVDERLQFPVQIGTVKYDLDSIMHYYTLQLGQSNPERCSARNVKAWADPDNHDENNLRIIWRAPKPSELDIAWVKGIYPWQPHSAALGAPASEGAHSTSTLSTVYMSPATGV